ncbi:c-type cytochrome [Persephonella sp.]
MRKAIIGLAVAAVALTACKTQSTQKPPEAELKKGYLVYKNNCSACHWETVSPEKMRKLRQYVREHGRPPFGAPPMSEVSARVKKFYPTEEEFVAFVKDYITNPSREKGVCLPRAYKIFGVMPAVGKNMSDEAKEAVAKWLYYRFDMTWEEFMKKHPH